MKLKMLETRQGSPDGVTVLTYKKGEIVDVPAELAHVFLSESWARWPDKKKVTGAASGAVTMKTKNQGGAPENK